MPAAFERVFLDFDQLRPQEPGRGQLLARFLSRWKHARVELFVFVSGQADAAIAELDAAGLRPSIEEVCSLTIPKVFATKGARLLAGLKSEGWIPREQLLVDNSITAIQSVFLDEVGDARRCVLAHTFRAPYSQTGLSEAVLDELDKIISAAAVSKVTTHTNLFEHRGALAVDPLDSPTKCKVDQLTQSGRQDELRGYSQVKLTETLRGRPDFAQLLGVAPVPIDVELPEAPPAGAQRPAARAAAGGDRKRSTALAPLWPEKAVPGRPGAAGRPSGAAPPSGAGRAASPAAPRRSLVRTNTLSEHEVAEGMHIQVKGGAHEGKFGVVLRITGDPGSKRYKVQLQDGAQTWATKVRGTKPESDGAAPQPMARGAVVSPLMAALQGTSAKSGAPPKGSGKGGAPAPPPGGFAQKPSQLEGTKELFLEGAAVEVTRGAQSGKIGTVVKITGDGKDKKWRVQIEEGGPCSWVEGVKATDRVPKEAPKVIQISDLYNIEKKKLGSGAYGSVTKVMNKATGLTRAMKTIPKPMVKKIEDIWREVDFMKRLDHPNIIKIYDTFEDHRNVYLVMELCLGGELFDRIIEAGYFSEVQAAVVMQNALRGVFYMHSKQICHRDLKPENFLLTSKEPVDKANLKIIDFGLAHDFPQPGQYLRTRTGSAYYVAPQVLAGEYDELADMWSFGVILYTILCGYPPFQGETDPEIMAEVKTGKYTFPDAEWSIISSDAKDLVKKLLHFDPKGRFSAEEAMRHTWMQNKAPRATPGRHGSIVVNLRSFQGQNKLKKVALQAIANQMSESQIEGLRDTFQVLDENQDGLLTMQELRDGLPKIGLKEVPTDLQNIMDHVDRNCSGALDYTEFLAATLDRKLYQQEDLCWAAFRIFDKNGDGRLCREEVAEVLQDSNVRQVATAELSELMKALDTNGDGVIDFKEFMVMIKA